MRQAALDGRTRHACHLSGVLSLRYVQEQLPQRIPQSRNYQPPPSTSLSRSNAVPLSPCAGLP